MTTRYAPCSKHDGMYTFSCRCWTLKLRFFLSKFWSVLFIKIENIMWEFNFTEINEVVISILSWCNQHVCNKSSQKHSQTTFHILFLYKYGPRNYPWMIAWIANDFHQVCRIEYFFSCKFRCRNESFEMRLLARSCSTRRTKLWKLCTAMNFRK